MRHSSSCRCPCANHWLENARDLGERCKSSVRAVFQVRSRLAVTIAVVLTPGVPFRCRCGRPGTSECNCCEAVKQRSIVQRAFLQRVQSSTSSGWRKNGEQAQDQGERSRAQRDREPRHTAALRPAQRAAPARPALRLRSRAVRCVLGAAGRQGDPLVRDAGCRRQRQGDHDARGHAGAVCEVARHVGARLRLRCIRCSRRGSTCRCRIAATARTG